MEVLILHEIALVGAYDRYNYGDILLPHIITDVYKGKYKCDYYALIDSDLSNIGGFKTNSIKRLYSDNHKYKAIIIVGGDVFASSWFGMYICYNYWDIYPLKILHRIMPEITEMICKKKLSGKSRFPWIFNNVFNTNVKIIYNCVGGYRENDKQSSEELKLLSRNASYISCRDIMALNSIEKRGFYVPDSAIIMSDIYGGNYLEDNVSNKVKMICNEPYVVFQSRKIKSREKEKRIGEQLDVFTKKTGLKVVLLPIGFANAHEDLKALKNIYQFTNHATLITEATIWEIMYIIAHSRAFVGSSLHGCITAASFNVPSCPMDNKIAKQEFFYNGWKVPTVPNNKWDINYISENYSALINNFDKNILRIKVNDLKNMVCQNLTYIDNIIND